MGYNFEPSEIGAAFGLVQLQSLRNNILKRQENFLLQCNFFKKYADYFEIPKELEGISTAWLAFPILLKEICSTSIAGI